jgi:hypothetical protein
MARTSEYKRRTLTLMGVVASLLAAIIALCFLVIFVRSYAAVYQRPMTHYVGSSDAALAIVVYWITSLFIAIVVYYAARSGRYYARVIFLTISVALALGSTVSAFLVAPHVSLPQDYTYSLLTLEIQLASIPALSIWLCILAFKRWGPKTSPIYARKQ